MHNGTTCKGFRQVAIILELDHERSIHFNRKGKRNNLGWRNYTINDSKEVYIRHFSRK
jgi:hypothetical protein